MLMRYRMTPKTAEQLIRIIIMTTVQEARKAGTFFFQKESYKAECW